MVFGDDGPAVAHFFDLALACIDHGLNGERHAGFEHVQGARTPVVQDLGLLMKNLANPMTAKFSDNGEPQVFGKLLNGPANVAQVGTGLAS